MFMTTHLRLLLILIVGALASLCLFAAPKPAKSAVRAKYVVAVADDFIVEVYHNGVPVPDSKRRLLDEKYGATVERTEIEVHKGDWLVFNVVNNRLRWNGVAYFGAAGVLAPDEFGVVTKLSSGDWSVCDNASQASGFIATKDFMRDNRPVAIERPWDQGAPLMKQHAGDNWSGDALWGRTHNTWIKVVVQ